MACLTRRAFLKRLAGAACDAGATELPDASSALAAPPVLPSRVLGCLIAWGVAASCTTTDNPSDLLHQIARTSLVFTHAFEGRNAGRCADPNGLTPLRAELRIERHAPCPLRIDPQGQVATAWCPGIAVGDVLSLLVLYYLSLDGPLPGGLAGAQVDVAYHIGFIDLTEAALANHGPVVSFGVDGVSGAVLFHPDQVKALPGPAVVPTTNIESARKWARWQLTSRTLDWDGDGCSNFLEACQGIDRLLDVENHAACPTCPYCDRAAPDLCNGIDDDCDPLTQDGSAEAVLGEACDGADADRCADGTLACNGASIVCVDDHPLSTTCGDGVQDNGEICDGDCPSECADGDPCTRDKLLGSPECCNATCAFEPIIECAGADGCCPPGCFARNDSDCPPAEDHVPCATHSDCRSGYCILNVCRPGPVCSDNRDCLGSCIQGLCTARSGACGPCDPRDSADCIDGAACLESRCWLAGTEQAFVPGAPSFPRCEQAVRQAVEQELPLCSLDAVGVAWLFYETAAARPKSGSNDYVRSPEGDLEALRRSVDALLDFSFTDARLEATSAGYELCHQEHVALWRPLHPEEGAPTAAVRLTQARPLIVEVPHPGFEFFTLDRGLDVFADIRARALLVAGTHRCANHAFTLCSGETPVCGASEPHRISDMAHNEDTLFHAAHTVLAERFSGDLVLGLHGMVRSGASLSDGTMLETTIDSPVARLATHLHAQLPQELVTSCNYFPTALHALHLCGPTDVQGRDLNASPSVCFVNATGSSQRFIHLELSLDLRKVDDLLSQAMDAIVPP